MLCLIFLMVTSLFFADLWMVIKRINVPPGHRPGQLLSPSAYEVAVMMGNEMMAQALVSRGASTLSVQLDEFNDGL